MKKRENIDEKYKWDLSSYIKNDEEIQEIFNIIKKLTEIYPKYKNKLNNKELLLEKLTKYRNENIKVQKLFCYLSHMQSVDSSNTKILALYQEFINLYAKLEEADSYFYPQLLNLDIGYLNSLLEDARFKDFSTTIKDIIKSKSHKISESDNALLSKMSKFINNNETINDILTNSELTFEDAIDKKGKKHKVNNETYSKYLDGKDRALRMSAVKSRNNSFKNFNKTFAEVFVNDMQYHDFQRKLENFPSLLEKKMFADDVPIQVFHNLIKNVNKNLKLLRDFVKTQKTISKLKDFNICDLFQEDGFTKKISIQQAHEICINALSPLGEEYLSIVERKLSDNSIDYLPNQNKYSGGYCSNCYDAKTIILMNYKYDLESVSTLIHEMGHCVNAEYFNASQPYEKAEITPFAAEIASTVNEILLNVYMQNNSKNKKEKAYYFKRSLEEARRTIFTQTFYSEFEYGMHTLIEQDKPVTYEEINNSFLNIQKKYYGNSCIVPTISKYSWARIPHFFSPYYVYSYATGMVCAINIVNKILENSSFVNKYIEFLKNGLNKPAFEILKEIGIDLSTDAPYETAFSFLNEQLKHYNSICK